MPYFFPTAGHGLPPTPPETCVGNRMEMDAPFYPTSHSAFPPRYTQTGCEFIEQYSQAACFANQASLHAHPQSMHPMHVARELSAHQSVLAQQASQNMFGGGLAGAPVLPPPRSNVKLPPMDSAIPPQYRRQEQPVQQEQRPKEDKAVGGVAAHLDYEMDQMSDFVAEMAQGIVYPGSPVPPQFRKYVYQILSSTRLPSSTILLGLFYLASRMRQLSSAGVFMTGSSQVYRFLTIALLLGSKFLDDNTFQNRSWSEVSNIPVAELNEMELDWLFAFEWKIHERMYSQQDGFMTWKAHWDTWRSKAAARATDCHKLTPLDTNVQRQQPSVQPKALLSPEGPIPPQYQRSNRIDRAWLNPNASEYSPPSAPQSGPNTPDYFAAGTWGFVNPPPPYSRWVGPTQQFMPQPRSQPPSYHHTPSYTHPFAAQSVWTGHGSSCGCLYCAKHQEHYLTASNFGIQPIVC